MKLHIKLDNIYDEEGNFISISDHRRFWIDGEGYYVISSSGECAFNCEDEKDWAHIGLKNITVLGRGKHHGLRDILTMWKFGRIAKSLICLISRLDYVFNKEKTYKQYYYLDQNTQNDK